MHAIVGAGPAGLYLGIKLHQLGVRDVVIYDPRAGKYTRAGHITHEAYAHGVAAIPHAQIDSDYSRANGILHGMHRTDALITCMTVSKARIDACNLEQCRQLLRSSISIQIYQ